MLGEPNCRQSGVCQMDAGNRKLEVVEARENAAPDPQEYGFLDRGAPPLFQCLTELATAATGCCCAWIGWPMGDELHLSCRVGLNVSSVFMRNSHSREVLATGQAWISGDVDLINWDLDAHREMGFLGIWPLRPVGGAAIATFSVAGLRAPPRGAMGNQMAALLSELTSILMEVERLRRTRRGNRAAWAGLWQAAEAGLEQLLNQVQASQAPLVRAAEGLARLIDELAGLRSRDRCMPEPEFRSRAEDIDDIDQRLVQLQQQMSELAQALTDQEDAAALDP